MKKMVECNRLHINEIREGRMHYYAMTIY